MLNGWMASIRGSSKLHTQATTCVPHNNRQVRAILLDPSCSGSGMVASLERQVDANEEGRKNWRAGVKDGGPTARLKALAEFQQKALVKAFSFPQVCMWWL